MRKKIVYLLQKWKNDYIFRIFFSCFGAAVINILFAAYNGVLGIFYLRIWNVSICVYYILLAVIRIIIVYSIRKFVFNGSRHETEYEKKIFKKTHILLLTMNLSMTVPIFVMVTGNRSYSLGLIPAIATAVYTTYRVATAFVHFKRSGSRGSVLMKEICVINLVDAMMAVLILQNTLIIVNNTEQEKDMTLFSAATSGLILVFIFSVSVCSFIKGIKKYNTNPFLN